MGDNINFMAKWKTTSILRKMEDDLNFKVNGRQPQFSVKRTSIILQIEDDNNLLTNIRCLFKYKTSTVSR